MIWAILIFLGVPLWICAAGITFTVLKNRGLRSRPGDIPVRVMLPGKKRWTRGHALWVSDVFAFRASPASWNEALVHVTDVTLRSPSGEEQHALRRLADDVVIATLSGPGDLTLLSGQGDVMLDVAAPADRSTALVGPFVTAVVSGATAATSHVRGADLSTERS